VCLSLSLLFFFLPASQIKKSTNTIDRVKTSFSIKNKKKNFLKNLSFVLANKLEKKNYYVFFLLFSECLLFVISRMLLH